MDWKNATDEEYDAAKDEVIEKVVLHLRYPKDFGCPRLTQDEIALVLSPDKDHVLSKMTICKDEIKAMSKFREGLAKIGITKFEDVYDAVSGRTPAEALDENA